MFCFYGFLSFYWILEKSFEVIRNIKKFRLEEAGPSYDQKFVFYFIPGQNIWNKNSVKLGRTWKLLYLILSILSLPLSNFNFWQEGYVPTQIWFFFYLFYFLRFYVLGCSTNQKTTRISSLLYNISSFALLIAKRVSVMKRNSVPYGA